MIVLPLAPKPAPVPTAMLLKSREKTLLKVLVLGFSPGEQKLLQEIVALSMRRSPSIELRGHRDAHEVDVVMIDAKDAGAKTWAAIQPDLENKAVIWVDAQSAPKGHTILQRPVQWPMLPLLLQQAMDQGPQSHSDTSALSEL